MVDVDELRSDASSIVWYHRIDLGHGIVTDGFCESYLAGAQLPTFEGRTVLDVGAWDGYYSFLAERQGASRVVALDHYVWGVDFAQRNPYWIDCHEKGVLPDHARDTTAYWDPSLPGRRGFDLAHRTLDSRVEPVLGDFMQMDLDAIGTFDVVLFLGVLYHLKEPLAALERIRRLTKGVAVIETEALLLPGGEQRPVMEFTAGCYRGFDYSNWFTPTVEALHDLCRAAGFTEIETVAGPPAVPAPPSPSTGARIERALRRRLGRASSPDPAPGWTHYRALVHARP